jgi:hypothetical protein
MRGSATAVSAGLCLAVVTAVGGRLLGQELPPVPRTAGQASSGTLDNPIVSTGQTPALFDADHSEVSVVDPFIEPAAWLQQPSAAAPTEPAVRRSTRGSRQANVGLASVPNMFGDLAGATSVVQLESTPLASVGGGSQFSKGMINLPMAGGGSRVGKISENDSPIPRDRIFFSYNHFQNVIQLSETPSNPPGPPLMRQEPIDRYTMGLEKTFFDGRTSVEVRMPLQGTIDAQLQTVGLSSNSVGNLTVVLKSLLYMDYSLAVGAGMAIETPTGGDMFVRLSTANLQFQNQTTHLLPYIGFVWSPGDPRWGWGSGLFLSGFAQIDINTSSNAVDVLGPNHAAVGTLGKLTDQNLGFLDLAAGYWIYRDPDAPRLTGVAAVTELHYTTTLQNADQIGGTANGTGISLNATGNRFDVLNGTVGVQFLMFDASSLRIAGVFPLGGENRRLFDSEVQVQFNRRF